MDKKLAAEKIPARLQKRPAVFFGCEVGDLPRMKLGTLVHTALLLWGDSEELGGFHTTMGGVLQLVGNEIVWEPKTEEAETPKVVINLPSDLTRTYVVCRPSETPRVEELWNSATYMITPG